MSGTGEREPAPRDDPAADAAAEDDSPATHAFFRAVEESFLKLRGAAVLLSPEDWQVARRWRREGIPLDLIARVMADVFARRAGKRGRRISSLRYFAPAVDEAFDDWRELAAGGARLAPEPALSIEERLARLAAALPLGLALRAEWAGRITALAGEPEAVESALAALDTELRAAALEALEVESRRALEAQVERALERARQHVPPAERAAARERLLAQLLRRETGLPLLSLFSPEASGPPPREESADERAGRDR